MKRAMATVGLAALGLAAPACSTNAAGDGTVKQELDGLPGVEVRIPEGTRVSKNAVGFGVMLKGPGVSMTIGAALDVDATTLEEAKENAQSYSPTNLEGETLPDGYLLTYENQGSMGTTYWLVGRRRLGNVAYSCGVRSPKKDHQQSAIAICKSLER